MKSLVSQTVRPPRARGATLLPLISTALRVCGQKQRMWGGNFGVVDGASGLAHMSLSNQRGV